MPEVVLMESVPESECKLVYERHWYTEDFMRSLSYGCYNRNTFNWKTRDGVVGTWLSEGTCPIHGIATSMLGGVPLSGIDHHPCGAYVKESFDRRMAQVAERMKQEHEQRR